MTRAEAVCWLQAEVTAALAIRETCGEDSDAYREARITLNAARRTFAAIVGAETEGSRKLQSEMRTRRKAA